MKIILPLAFIAFVLGMTLSLNYFDKTNQSSSPSPMQYPTGGDFTLMQGKQKVSFSDYHGKIRLIFFGYTSCPDICPTSLALISSSLKQLNPRELAQVQVFFISVDPDRDTPKKLAAYTKYFHPNILGVTGTTSEIDQVVKQYGTLYRKVESDSAMGYLVDHSASVFVIDKKGKVVDMLPHGLPTEEITKAIRTFI